MRFIYLTIIACVCSCNFVIAQLITIDNTIPVEDLIENNLANNCVDISNVTSSLNGSVNGFSSFGSFQSAGSNFPLSSGIILSTGNAASGGNTTNTTDLSDGTLSWGTDPDIESALGVGNTVNATVIEFDFVALSSAIQFNYLLASEEYYANYPCNSSDGFAFLIREVGSTGPYQNIALIPGTNTPVTVNNIHDEIITQCPAANAQYFDGYNFGNTNYNGRTTVLTAASNVTPNIQYHVKLIVADQGNDPSYDTAVFIEANTFNALELGDDINTCSGSVSLNGEIQNPQATYAWYRDNALLPGEIAPILTITDSGLYRVEVTINGLDCVITDDINVTIDTELSTNPISPYALCDDDGNGVETFDLASKNQDVVNAISNLPANYTISYYYTDADARNNPSNDISSPISSGPTTIFVRVEDTDQGCLIYGEFNLEVNAPPAISQPADWDVCDNDDTPNNQTAVDLREKDSEITNGQTNLGVSYHTTPLDANNGTNRILPPYNVAGPSETLYVRVTDNLTGCVSTTSLTINITNGNTQIVRDLQYIDACDVDHDGAALFDLTQVINDILNGETNFLPPTYHTNQSDAESGVNPISDPANYQYTNAVPEPGNTTVYVRLVDSTTGCYAIVPIEIHTNLLLTGTDTGEFALCDDSDNNNSVDFDLYVVESFIIGQLPFPITVTFYNNQDDLDNNNNPINKDDFYPVSTTTPTTLFIKIENTATGCIEEEDIILRVNPVLLFSSPTPLPYCDTDDDGVANVFLPSFDATILNGNTDFAVTYFPTLQDAETNNTTNQLPNTYAVDQQATLWARIENIDTGCHTENSFDIEVSVAPTTTTPTDIIICDNDQDGFSIINLEAKIPEVVSNANGLNISFHTSYDNANTSTNAITSPTAYNANTQTIYIRIEDTTLTTICPAIESFNIIVNTTPIIPNITPYKICVDIGITSANFVFADKDAEILNGQTGKEVFYFEDSAFTTPINKNNPYSSSGLETIYIRVENISDANCNSTGSFTIEVATNPNYNTNFSDFPPVCQSVAGNNTFDLESKRQEIALGSSDNLNIQFYLNENDALNNTGTPLPNQYTSNALQGQFYVRIENLANLCAVVEEVRFITFPTPHIISATIAPVCDVDYDGNSTIDLVTTVFNIENVRFSDVAISYYEDEDLTIEIPTSQINAYPASDGKIIYVKAEIESTGCSDSMPLELHVNIPPVTTDIGTIPICDNDTNTFDLTQVNTLITSESSISTISYHNSQNNAENNLNPIGDTFNYTSSNHTIYARVANNNTGCHTIQSFILEINSNPVANTPPNLMACDDDFDGFLEFDLSPTSNTYNAILGTQNASNYTISYYSSSTNAESATNALPFQYIAINGEIIYARLENIYSSCYDITRFTTIVNPLPVIPIDDVETLCLNDLPMTLSAETGNPGDTYEWDNGQTTPEIQLNTQDLGNHWVRVTTPNNCSYRKEFSLIESEAANINFTTTVDFADPNSITVNISGIGNYLFILDDGEPQTSNVFNNVTLGVHLVTIRDLNGCEDVTTEVFVIDIPKFFTPNNDSYFDTWHVVGIEQLPGTAIYIYNRYGKLIKNLPHTSNGWDGTYNGENMPADDYWFIAKIIQNGEAFEIKGHFALKR